MDYVCLGAYGQIIFAITEPLCGLFGVEIAAALVLKLAMQLIVSRDLDFVEFESDNQSVINLVFSLEMILLKVGLAIEEIKILSSGHSFWCFLSMDHVIEWLTV